MAQRLTEEDIHTACTEIAARGERPTALTLLNRLGRGSLTTITKHLNSWNASDDAKVLGVSALPVVVELPSELTKDGENLIKKLWTVAKGLAEEELDIQREALKQAEINNQTKVEEAFKFSEAQALKNERLEDTLESLKVEVEQKQADYLQVVSKLNEAEKINVGLLKDNERLQNELNALITKMTGLEESHKNTLEEKQLLQQNFHGLLKQKEAEIHTAVLESEKKISNLEGQLATYKSLDKTEN
jgi:DNA polymerase III psi subunit